jgi:hypothetical protein
VTPTEVLETVMGFLSVLEGPLHPEGREAALRLALDRLALASHFAEDSFDAADYAEPPDTAYDVLRAKVTPLFPELGYYNVALDTVDKVGDSELGVGDALDDLVDIARELQAVLLRWETTSEADALWHFHQGFKAHWGKHLRSLQLYLHERAHWPS